jgi:hypothetical protein
MTTKSVVVIAEPKKVKKVTLEAVVIRADGRRENLGVVAEKDYRPWYQRFLEHFLNEFGMAVLQVNTGRAIVTGRLLGTAQAIPQFGGWGTGAGVTAAADTTLFTEDSGGTPVYARIAATLTQVTTATTNDTLQLVYTIVANAVKTITNAGVFDALTVGNPYVKGDFAGIPLSTNDAIQFTFKVQYS